MIGVLVKLNIKEGSEKDFEENMLKLVEATNANEPGVFYYGLLKTDNPQTYQMIEIYKDAESHAHHSQTEHFKTCLLYTSPSPRDRLLSRMPSSA